MSVEIEQLLAKVLPQKHHLQQSVTICCFSCLRWMRGCQSNLCPGRRCCTPYKGTRTYWRTYPGIFTRPTRSTSTAKIARSCWGATIVFELTASTIVEIFISKRTNTYTSKLLLYPPLIWDYNFVCCSSDRLINEQISIAMETREHLTSQRQTLKRLQTRFNDISNRYPVINSLIQRINLRKRRDSIILGLIVSACTILMLIYAFS